MLFPLILVVWFASNGVAAQCEPGFADSCFTSVQTDLKYMLNLPEGLALNLSSAAIEELCLGLDDALNCTSDVIDSDCTAADGRDIFDSWVVALRAVYSYLCDSNGEKFLSLLQSIQCWNINNFLVCTEEMANLDHVRELLHTELSGQECRNLRMTFNECFKQATVDSCREQEYIKEEFSEMVDTFFKSSYCEYLFGGRSGAAHVLPVPLALYLSPLFLSLLATLTE